MLLKKTDCNVRSCHRASSPVNFKSIWVFLNLSLFISTSKQTKYLSIYFMLNWSVCHVIVNCVCNVLCSISKNDIRLIKDPWFWSTPSPIGPPQCAASLSCSSKKRTISGRLSPKANIPNVLWTRWRKDSTGLPVRLMMGLTTKALQLPNLSPMKLKIRVILSYPTHKVFVKVSKRPVVDMAFKPTSKVVAPSKASWSPPRTKTLWSTKVVPSIGTNVVT